MDATALHQPIVGLGYGASGLRRTVPERELERALVGRELASTRRHGKHLFVDVLDGDWLRLHFGMTGALRYYRRGGEPDHTRLRIDFGNGFHLAFQNTRKLGMIALLGDPDGWVREEGLGPDALDVSAARFRSLLEGRRGMIKSLLMNQHVVAGLGNVYADEVLFQAAVHPRTSVVEIGGEGLAGMRDTMVRVLEGAVEARARPERMPSGWLMTHRHPGARCPVCERSLESVKVSGRTSYFCPHRQAE